MLSSIIVTLACSGVRNDNIHYLQHIIVCILLYVTAIENYTFSFSFGFEWDKCGESSASFFSIYAKIHCRDIVFEKVDVFLFDQGKNISNDQELIQSDPISYPQDQKGSN